MDKRIKNLIDSGNTDYMMDYFSDVYYIAIDEDYEEGTQQEDLYLVYNYIYTKLKSIADKHEINPQRLPLLDEVNGRLKQIKILYQNKNYDEALYEYDKVIEIIRKYISGFVPYLYDVRKVIDNPDLIDRKQELIDSWAMADKENPLNKPQIISDKDEDGWIVMDSEGRLETDKEVEARVEQTLKWRQKTLDSSTFANKEMFMRWYQFICNIKELSSLNIKIIENRNKIYYKVQESKLKQFKLDKEFYNKLLKIMEHDKDNEVYWYHGTQDLDSAYSILEHGLIMAKDELTTTAYSEFSPDKLLLYSRGFCGEIGRDAVVIFRQPRTKNGVVDIIKKNTKKIKVSQSGLGLFQDKLDYIIPSEYMVGIVNKRDHKVIYANDLLNKQSKGL